ncbi:hypothetical protein KJ586_00810 [Patescibacteria group bacterium]|nr:hypothetical protein [Patescibacteria group bacterium]MBU4347502.1 hypothetical protein [Patescibacteria group bacterium]MBU4455036.1 hypothetical protein [Patescibacteria group bacterium]MCG2690785.1 hypothetical protein [Candidatus Parcubacteria bacterium]
METKEKIDILLKEYDMLRIEARDRMRGRLAIVGYFTVLAAFFEVQTQLSLFWVFFFTCITLGSVWFYFWILLKRVSAHLMKLEKRINSLAGEELLTWEQKVSYRRTFLLSRVLDKFRFNCRN